MDTARGPHDDNDYVVYTCMSLMAAAMNCNVIFYYYEGKFYQTGYLAPV